MTSLAPQPKVVTLPPLSVLLVKKADVWVAQCLEYDITAQGKEIDDARKSFERVLLAHVMSDLDANRQPLDGVPPAPADIHEMFRSSKRLAERPAPILVPPSTTVPRDPPVWTMKQLQVNELRVH